MQKSLLIALILAFCAISWAQVAPHWNSVELTSGVTRQANDEQRFRYTVNKTNSYVTLRINRVSGNQQLQYYTSTCSPVFTSAAVQNCLTSSITTCYAQIPTCNIQGSDIYIYTIPVNDADQYEITVTEHEIVATATLPATGASVTRYVDQYYSYDLSSAQMTYTFTLSVDESVVDSVLLTVMKSPALPGCASSFEPTYSCSTNSIESVCRVSLSTGCSSAGAGTYILRVQSLQAVGAPAPIKYNLTASSLTPSVTALTSYGVHQVNCPPLSTCHFSIKGASSLTGMDYLDASVTISDSSHTGLTEGYISDSSVPSASCASKVCTLSHTSICQQNLAKCKSTWDGTAYITIVNHIVNAVNSDAPINLTIVVNHTSPTISTATLGTPSSVDASSSSVKQIYSLSPPSEMNKKSISLKATAISSPYTSFQLGIGRGVTSTADASCSSGIFRTRTCKPNSQSTQCTFSILGCELSGSGDLYIEADSNNKAHNFEVASVDPTTLQANQETSLSLYPNEEQFVGLPAAAPAGSFYILKTAFDSIGASGAWAVHLVNSQAAGCGFSPICVGASSTCDYSLRCLPSSIDGIRVSHTVSSTDGSNYNSPSTYKLNVTTVNVIDMPEMLTTTLGSSDLWYKTTGEGKSITLEVTSSRSVQVSFHDGCTLMKTYSCTGGAQACVINFANSLHVASGKNIWIQFKAETQTTQDLPLSVNKTVGGAARCSFVSGGNSLIRFCKGLITDGHYHWPFETSVVGIDDNAKADFTILNAKYSFACNETTRAFVCRKNFIPCLDSGNAAGLYSPPCASVCVDSVKSACPSSCDNALCSAIDTDGSYCSTDLSAPSAEVPTTVPTASTVPSQSPPPSNQGPPAPQAAASGLQIAGALMLALLALLAF